METFEAFKREGYMQKLKMAITLQAMDLSKEDLVVFMCKLVTPKFDGMYVLWQFQSIQYPCTFEAGFK